MGICCGRWRVIRSDMPLVLCSFHTQSIWHFCSSVELHSLRPMDRGLRRVRIGERTFRLRAQEMFIS